MTTMASPTHDPGPSPGPTPGSSGPTGALPLICPFCGSVNNQRGSACSHCSLEDTPATRQATKIRIGPWYVLQSRNPAAPGMKFATLQSLIRKNLVTPHSVIRGPTTFQLWRLAVKVKGVSREFGVCYSCGEHIDTTASLCLHCNRSQALPADPDALLDLPQASHPRPEFHANHQAHHHTDDESPPPAGAQATDPQIHPEPPTQRPAARPSANVSSSRSPRSTTNQSVTAERPDRQTPLPDLLTPQDLAKAFQLGYDAPAKPRIVRQFSFVVRLAIVLVLLVGAVGVACYFNPSLPTGVWNWLQQNIFNSAEPTSPNAKPPPASTHASAEFKMPPPSAAAPVEARLAAVTVAADNIPAPQPAVVVSPATQPAAFNFADTAAKLAIENTAITDAKKLWAAGLEAESQRNFSAALKAYEQIESLPNSVWPAGLHTRIHLAREESKAGTKW